MPHVTGGVVALPTAAEVAVASIAIGPPPVAGAAPPPAAPAFPCRVYGKINLTTGATVTAVVLRLRAGIGLAGAVIGGPETITIGAAASDTIPFDFYDDAAAGAGGYTVSIASTGATGAGQVNATSMTQDPA